jgi:hypothetical protein
MISWFFFICGLRLSHLIKFRHLFIRLKLQRLFICCRRFFIWRKQIRRLIWRFFLLISGFMRCVRRQKLQFWIWLILNRPFWLCRLRSRIRISGLIRCSIKHIKIRCFWLIFSWRRGIQCWITFRLRRSWILNILGGRIWFRLSWRLIKRILISWLRRRIWMIILLRLKRLRLIRKFIWRLWWINLSRLWWFQLRRRSFSLIKLRLQLIIFISVLMISWLIRLRRRWRRLSLSRRRFRSSKNWFWRPS